VALILIVFGSQIADSLASKVGLGVSFRLAWALISWLVIIACVFLAFTCTYYFAPDVDQEFRWVRFGSIASVALWLVFTLAFSVYVNYLAAPEETYGALAGVAVFMLYLYGSTVIVLLGAEMNQVLEDADPAGKDTGERAASP
jgi:membrane protein